MEPLPGLTPEPDPAPTFLRRLGTTLLDYARLIAFFLGPLLIGLVIYALAMTFLAPDPGSTRGGEEYQEPSGACHRLDDTGC